MNDIEFFGQIKPQRLSSFEEDFKKSRYEFRKDELNRTLRLAGKLNTEVLETTYERFPEED